MKNSEELKRELEELSPFLQKMKERESGFEAPKNYFKSLPDEVLKRLGAESPAQRHWLDGLADLIQNLWQPRFAVALATMAVLIAAGVYFFENKQQSVENQPIAEAILDEIPVEDLQSYIASNIEDFDDEMILETQFTGQEAPSLPKVAPQVGTGELEDYLDDVIDEIDLDDLEDLL